jgi:hypothetical protein
MILHDNTMGQPLILHSGLLNPEQQTNFFVLLQRIFKVEISNKRKNLCLKD